jgi:hypothetical protein
VFYVRAEAVTAIKQAALDAASRQYLKRFVHGAPRAKAPKEEVSVNPLPAFVVSLRGELGGNEIASTTELVRRRSESRTSGKTAVPKGLARSANRMA